MKDCTNCISKHVCPSYKIDGVCEPERTEVINIYNRHIRLFREYRILRSRIKKLDVKLNFKTVSEFGFKEDIGHSNIPIYESKSKITCKARDQLTCGGN